MFIDTSILIIASVILIIALLALVLTFSKSRPTVADVLDPLNQAEWSASHIEKRAGSSAEYLIIPLYFMYADIHCCIFLQCRMDKHPNQVESYKWVCYLIMNSWERPTPTIFYDSETTRDHHIKMHIPKGLQIQEHDLAQSFAVMEVKRYLSRYTPLSFSKYLNP